MSENAIVFNNVTKYFDKKFVDNGGLKNYLLNIHKRNQYCSSDKKVVLDNISFSIKKGESVGFVGRNGAGKSTLLSLIANVLKANSGDIKVNGQVSSMLELGAGFHSDLNGKENIELYGILMGFTRTAILSRIDEIVEFSELGEYIDAPIRLYSSGMLAKLGFAVISQLDPEIIIVDEVLAVGDFKFREKCIDVFQRFREEEKTMVIVSHGAADLENNCDRIIWIRDGKIAMDGNPKLVLDAYHAQ